MPTCAESEPGGRAKVRGFWFDLAKELSFALSAAIGLQETMLGVSGSCVRRAKDGIQARPLFALASIYDRATRREGAKTNPPPRRLRTPTSCQLRKVGYDRKLSTRPRRPPRAAGAIADLKNVPGRLARSLTKRASERAPQRFRFVTKSRLAQRDEVTRRAAGYSAPPLYPSHGS
ncbi:hypothetical protein DSM21852_42610 (plasmid) [Methylocystis bryophila]|nr:hypothetical protein DSM21852_42610 [Methylocystis bryophila]